MKPSDERMTADLPPTRSQRFRGYAVHAYTASGVAFAFLAAAEMCSPAPSARTVFLYLFAALLVDATDGPLARAWHVKTWAPLIDGRTIDDIVDYLTFTFLPLLLIWRMGWLPEPAMVWVIPALMASLFGFAHRGAKDETAGFFLGFPSYWNIVAFYAGLWTIPQGRWINAGLIIALALMTVLPVRFIYPNLAPKPWKLPLMIGALIWVGILMVILSQYPHAPLWLVVVSLLYPAGYGILSLWLDRPGRRAE
jgi:phosphatidylcholine synthase